MSSSPSLADDARTRDLRARAALVKVILEAVPGGVVHVALDGEIIEANAEALRILGYRWDELTRRYVVSFETATLREDGTPCAVDEYPVAQTLATREPAGPTTIGVRRPDGETSWAVFRAVPARNDAGQITGVLVTFVDITERKRAEEEGRRSETVWRTLAENLPDFVIVVGRDLRIRSINRVLPEHEMSAVIGSPADSYIEEAQREEWRQHFTGVLETGTPCVFETRAPGHNGGIVWFESRFVPLMESGRVESVLIVARDITERRTMIAQLAEKERLASIGMLSASVAHEIMNPLTSVLASLDFAMSDRCPPGARHTKALLDAREAAARMQQIVRDLRALGRTDAEDFFYVDVRPVIQTAVRLVGAEILRNVRVRVELEDVPDVLASESRLCQVFINLLTNAAHAVNEGPACPTSEREILVRTRTAKGGELVGVDISDTGPGIQPEHMARIFEPFFTTKRTGTGLGLSISKESLERMGGCIEVASRPGEGATFTVWLSTSRVPARAHVRANTDQS